MKTETLKDAAGIAGQPVGAAPAKAEPQTAEDSNDDAAVAAKKEKIRQLLSERQTIQASREENSFNTGKELDELHAIRAHRGNGTYDDDVKELGISKTTAWRLRNFYRDLAGLAPMPQFVSSETNSTTATASPANTVEVDVRSALINEGFKRSDVNQLVFDPSWGFDEAYRHGHQQLRPSSSGVTASGPSSSAPATAPTGAVNSAADILRARAQKQKKITQVRLDPARHELFHEKLTELAAALGTESDSETIFQIVMTCEVPPCAK